ncbi:MAG: aspartate aminotransferase [Nocardioidaceae bacterium]|jgi:aspartate aminotransferase|nr:aspartate aminotransferase [Nocardioidaceae bacterium]
MTTRHSATLAIDEMVQARREAGHQVLHLGFGEAGLPVAPGLVDVLNAAGGRNSYGPVVGSQQARAAAAGWFSRRGLPTYPSQIIYAPGSKPLLFALLASIEGDVVLPQPAWVTYAAQAALLERHVISVPITPEAGGVPDPSRLEDALRQARATGARPAVLVLTIPDNPTGTVATPEQVQAVCAIADRFDLAIICDEIYSELSHRGAPPSAASYLPERTVVTSGLSKSLALGGWRIGFARTPDSDWGRRLLGDLTGVASEIWSCLAAPMQAVATHVLGDPPDILAHIGASRRLHARVATAVHAEFTAAGAQCRPPSAGFYVYPDFASREEQLGGHGIRTSTDLATVLLERHGIATLPGSAFGDPDNTLTMRVATSLLYGTTPEQRWTALGAAQPERLPWVAESLAHLGHQLRSLTGASEQPAARPAARREGDVSVP